MKKFLLLTLILLLFPSISLAAEDEKQYSPANVKVIVNGKQIFFDQDPVIIHDRIMVPIRTIVESLGGTVEWEDPGHIIINKGEIHLYLNINSTVVSQQDRRFFYLEQPPIIVNGRTLVSIRFISEAIKSSVKWDENNRTVTILSDENIIGHEQPEDNGNSDNYYKLYEPIVGPASGPDPEEAKLYVLRQGLLNNVENIVCTPIRFLEYGGYDTMVSGSDELSQEKYIWLTKNRYTGEISVTGTALAKEGLTQETVVSIIEKKGIDKVNIKKIYAAPYYSKDQIAWFVIAEQENKKYYYCLDFYTGDVIENFILDKYNHLIRE